MKDCIKLEAETATLDPRNKLNYVFGMVMGVNDFRQEQEHFSWKHRLSNRLLHGCGTVCGLAVNASEATGGKDIMVGVTPGYAVSPKGNWMWIKEAQCGLLDAWLQANPPAIMPLTTARQVYLSLSYCQYPTELVPIAANACASSDQTQAPSRIVESFQLQFSWQAPQQTAEQITRDFGTLLRQVVIEPPISPSPDDSVAFLNSVGSLGVPVSPPIAPLNSSFHLPAHSATDTLEEALRIWVTVVCPRLETIGDDSLLLAALNFSVDATGHVLLSLDPQGHLLPASIFIDERQRPVLVSDRLKQELFTLIGQGSGHV